MKVILTFFKDTFLFLFILALLAGGVFGVRLPYRNTFTDSGPYQLEAFETGLAFFHYGRGETPFYNLSPLNDYLVIDATRSALLSKEVHDAKLYTATFKREKPEAIIETVYAFFEQAMPWYELQMDGRDVQYVSEKAGDELVVTRLITLPAKKMVSEQAMTVWYNTRDIVFDVKTGQVYTYATPSQTQEIAQFYDITLEPTLIEEYSEVETSGVVGIINPTRPGWLEVKTVQDQRLVLNRAYRLIEVVSPVNLVTDQLISAITITGHQAGE